VLCAFFIAAKAFLISSYLTCLNTVLIFRRLLIPKNASGVVSLVRALVLNLLMPMLFKWGVVFIGVIFSRVINKSFSCLKVNCVNFIFVFDFNCKVQEWCFCVFPDFFFCNQYSFKSSFF